MKKILTSSAKITKLQGRYVIDGKEYNSPSEVPESYKKKLEENYNIFQDKDKDGIPDFFQDTDSQSQTIFEINGKKYHSLSEMPDAEREMLIKAFKLLEDKDNNGIPDSLQDIGERIKEAVQYYFTEKLGKTLKENMWNYIRIAALIALIVLITMEFS